MKNLIAIILFLVCITAHAANPSMAQLNFTSNSLVAQINAGEPWTNANGTIRIAAADAGTTTVEIPNSASNSYFSFVRQADDNFPTAILNFFGGNTNGVNSHLTLVGGPGSEEIYFQNSLGVPLDLWPGQTDGANTLYLFNSFDARSNPGGYLLDVQNHGTSQFAVGNTRTTNATYIASLNGFASYATLATNAVTPTGWTNTAGVNVSGYITATAVSFTINDRSGAVLYTSPTLTATVPVSLQNGWSVRAASGLVGTILPW